MTRKMDMEKEKSLLTHLATSEGEKALIGDKQQDNTRGNTRDLTPKERGKIAFVSIDKLSNHNGNRHGNRREIQG